MEMLPWSLVVWSLALPATVVIRTRAPAHHQHRELQRFVDSFVDCRLLSKVHRPQPPRQCGGGCRQHVYVADYANIRVLKLAAPPGWRHVAPHLGVDGSGQRRFVREMVIQRADADLGVAPDLVERRRDGAVGGEPTASRLKQLASGPGRRHEKDSCVTEETSVVTFGGSDRRGWRPDSARRPTSRWWVSRVRDPSCQKPKKPINIC
jgi:hypothetical protein